MYVEKEQTITRISRVFRSYFDAFYVNALGAKSIHFRRRSHSLF